MELTKERSISLLLGDIERVFSSDYKSPRGIRSEEQKELLDSIAENRSILLNYLSDTMSLKASVIKARLTHVTLLSNKVYKAFLMYGKYAHFSSFELEREYYKSILSFIQQALEYAVRFSPRLMQELYITSFKLSGLKPIYNQKLKQVVNKLSSGDADEDFILLVHQELLSLLKRKYILLAEFSCAMLLMDALLKSPEINNQMLEKILIEHEFNSSAFYDYCIGRSMEIIYIDSSLHSQVENVISFQEKLKSFSKKSTWKFDHKNKSILEDLSDFFMQIKQSIKERIDTRRSEVLDGKLVEEHDKVEINLSVAQLGFLLRLFIDREILPTDNISRTYAFFAKHFRTKSAAFISRDSLIKKSTSVEFSTARKLKWHFIEIINSINKSHNLSNYKD